MAKNLKCPHCKINYSLAPQANHNHASVPLLMACGHTFCQRCVLSLHTNKHGFTCPICKSLTKCIQECGKLKGLLPNMSVMGYLNLNEFAIFKKLTAMMNGLQKKKILKRDIACMCSECIHNSATTHCVQCGVNFCAGCFEMLHKNSRVLGRHQGINVSKGSQDMSSLECNKHHLLNEFFCANDDVLICKECIQASHSEHKVLSLAEKYEDMKPELTKAIKESAVVANTLTEHISMLEDEILSVEIEAKERLNDIHDYYTAISGRLQSSFLRLVNTLERMACEHTQQLIALRESASKDLTTLELLQNDAQMLVDSSSETDPVVLDPVKILQLLKQSKEYPCVFEKPCFEEEKSSKRFWLTMNEDIWTELKNWGYLETFDRFKYAVHKAEHFDKPVMNGFKESDEDKVASDAESFVESSSQVSAGSTEKLRVLQVPPAHNQELVYVTVVSSPDDFYVQRNCDRMQLNLIQQTLKSFNTRHSGRDELFSSIQIGEMCVARSSNNSWCRARVTKVLKGKEDGDKVCVAPHETSASAKDEVELFLVDYGKRGKTKVSCLRCLPQKLKRIPSLALSCSLVGICPYDKDSSWSKEAVSLFTNMAGNRPILMTTMMREGGRRYVDLHKPAPDEIDNDVPVSVKDALIFLKLARFSGKQPQLSFVQESVVKARDYLRPTSLPLRAFLNVILSHFLSISKFYVQQLDSNATYLEDLTYKIQGFIKHKRKNGFDPSSEFAILTPHLGMPCLARYDCCEMWYRAKIIEILSDEQKVTVLYVDYGNEAKIDINKIFKIPDQFMRLPYQAIQCDLSNIQPPGNLVDWERESLDRFFELVGEDKQLKMVVKSVHENTHSVELFDWLDDTDSNINNVLSVNERLVHEGLATGLTAHKVVSTAKSHVKSDNVEDVTHSAIVTNGVDAVDKQAGSTMPTLSVQNDEKEPSDGIVTVIHCESPASFYVQNKEQWRASNLLTRELHKLFTDQSEEVTDKNWCVADLCAFYSSCEKRFCRGRLQDEKTAEEGNVTVQLLDFGFTEVTQSVTLKALPDKYVDVEPCVTRCFLADVQPAGGSKWTATAQQIFKEMVWKKECRTDISTNDEEEPLPVKLFLPDGENEVSRELVLRGVALPVLRMNSVTSPLNRDDPASKIKLHFEMSQAAYQRAENLRSAPTSNASASVQGSEQNDKEEVKSVEEVLKTENNAVVSSGSDTDCDNEELDALLQRLKTKPTTHCKLIMAGCKIPCQQAMLPGACIECVVSHIERHDLVYIKKLPTEEVFTDGTGFASSLPRLNDFRLGMPCLACFEEDNEWYRAEVTGINEGFIDVRFVDYGLKQTVTDNTRLLVLPGCYTNKPAQAISCQLLSMPDPDHVGMQEAEYMMTLANFLGQNKLLCVCSEQSTDANLPSINLYLMEEGRRVMIGEMFKEALK